MTTTPVSALSTPFSKQFNIPYPIVCAPMFLVSEENMVIQTCNAGALGTFPALNFRPIERYREAIKTIKSNTQKPFGINIIVQQSNRFQHEQLDIALQEKVALIITSLGSPRDTIKKAHAAGTKVYCDVINLDYAKKVIDLGADGLIAVGAGAGGHAGDTSLFALVPYLKRHIKLPVLAAGGIVDGFGMLAAMALGADGVYMGTRFIATKEANVSDDYKNAIVLAEPEDIVSTDRVDGFPGNFILTPKLEQHGIKDGAIESLLKRSKKFKRWIALARAARSLLGNPKDKLSYKTIFSAGHGVGLIDKIESIDHIIQETMSEYYQLKQQLP